MRGVVNVKKLTCGPELVLAGSGGGPGGEVVMVTGQAGAGAAPTCCSYLAPHSNTSQPPSHQLTIAAAAATARNLSTFIELLS